jgi:hypothetical protein
VTYYPEHWTWREGELTPGRAVVVDIDGVLSDASSRQHYLETPRQDWRSFFDACGEDPVIEEVHALLDLLEPDLQIVLLTARPHRVHHLTEAWLRRYDIRWDLLIMREWGDYDLARDFKHSTVWDLRRAGFDLVMAFEDDRRNVAMFRSEGIPTLYIHSGYYD